MKNNIKAIFVDLDDTIYPSSYYSEKARKNAIKNMIKKGLVVSEKKAKRELDKIIKKYGSNYLFHFDKLVEKLDKKAKHKEKIIAAGIIGYHKTKQKIKLFKDVKKVLRKLRKKYKIYLVSEGLKKKQWEKILRLGIEEYFDDFFIIEKKSVQVYRKILKKLRLSPQEVIMIGDHPKKDVEYAEKTGIRIIKVYNKKYLDKKEDTKKLKQIKNFSEILEIIESDQNG